MERVLRLRQHLQQSIERLAPYQQIPETAKEWRPYLALRYHYVDCLELAQVEQRLGLGDRQLLRERNRGLDALADIAVGRSSCCRNRVAHRGAGAAASSVRSRRATNWSVMSFLPWASSTAQTSICDVLDKARQSVSGLLAQHGVDD